MTVVRELSSSPCEASLDRALTPARSRGGRGCLLGRGAAAIEVHSARRVPASGGLRD